MEELSKRKIQQRENYRDRMQLGENDVVDATHQMRRNGEKESRDRDGEEQDQRKHVIGKLLNGPRAMVASTAPERKEHSDENHHGGDIENVEGRLSDQRSEME